MPGALHSPAYDHFRALIVAARKTAGLTQADLAVRLNRPQSLVSKYESGERRLDIVEFMQVCFALGIEPQTIIDDMRAVVGAEPQGGDSE